MGFWILIVDDEAALAQSLKMFLEDEADYEVRVCLSGELAVEAIKESCPDVCIADVRLPGMSGEDFVREAYKRCPNCAFIYHTGDAHYLPPSPAGRDQAMRHCVLHKPVIDMNVFLTAIRELLPDAP